MPANHLIYHRVRFPEIENQVQFADVAEVAVEGFDQAVKDFEGEEFVGVGIEASDEIQTGVPFINDFDI